MTNYVKTTDFAGKDALTSGNPAKAVKGVDLGIEFDAIATMSATKLDATASANPSASVGLAAVNGVSASFMRSDAAPPLSQAIAPTWTQQHVFTKSGSGTIAAAILNTSPQPSYAWLATAANANAKKWELVAGNNNLLLRTLNDAENSVGNVLFATRNANSQAIADLSFGNATDNPTYSFLGTGAGTVGGAWAFSGANTFSGLNTFSAARGVALQRAGNTSSLYWNTSAAADSGKYEVTTTGTNFVLRSLNDAENATGNILVTTRSGVSVSDLSFGNATSNPTYSFLGSGAVSIGDGAGSSFNVGFRDLPLNSQGSNYTAVITDRGKLILMTAGTIATIPANASVAFPVGTVLTICNATGGSLSIAITTDTLQLAGTGTTGTRTLANTGFATAIKVTSTIWAISGPGLT